jgi:F1F0 ATPase subunit 2
LGETTLLLRALSVGVLIGGIFYSGLWWTVRHGLTKKHIGIWVLGSFVLRTCIAVSGFYLAARDNWHALLACFIGFLLARVGVTRFTRIPIDRPANQLQSGAAR